MKINLWDIVLNISISETGITNNLTYEELINTLPFELHNIEYDKLGFGSAYPKSIGISQLIQFGFYKDILSRIEIFNPYYKPFPRKYFQSKKVKYKNWEIDEARPLFVNWDFFKVPKFEIHDKQLGQGRIKEYRYFIAEVSADKNGIDTIGCAIDPCVSIWYCENNELLTAIKISNPNLWNYDVFLPFNTK